ncbi:hypothetical protein BZA77DRAFT_317009 [Pyronema omphalodes]|nr:hypothetical protein BZA77DRAFT_317009 [Pyronema omphalodes]
MFPALTLYTLRTTLEKCGGDSERATDELLNRSFLEQDEEVNVRGVDAFEFATTRQKRKGKGRDNTATRGNQNGSTTSPNEDTNRRPSLPVETNTPEPISHWDRKNLEIKYLSENLGLPQNVVQSTHHASGSLPRTVATLIDKHGSESSFDCPEHTAELNELVGTFPTVSRQRLDRLLRLCQDNKTAVFNLAELLRQNTDDETVRQIAAASASKDSKKPRPAKKPEAIRIKVVGTDLKPPDSNTSSNCSTSPTIIHFHRPIFTNAADMRDVSAAYREARNEAFAKAAASYRRSKSNHLFGGAAAFYADLGKDLHIKTKEFENAAAERHVEENSGFDVIDLHGITVQQAIKIVRERVTQWWVRADPGGAYGSDFCAARGGNRVAKKPFKVVTGAGKHSKGGEPRIAPAVAKMLEREKWRITKTEGEILVWGVRK